MRAIADLLLKDKARMRFMRSVGGMLLLAIGIAVLLAGGTLSMVAGHRDAAGAFGGSLEPLETAGRAVVVPDLDALLRHDAPFVVGGGRTRLRITARIGGAPAFLGLGPAPETAGYLAAVPHATVDRVNIGRGPLPARLSTVTPPAAGPGLAPPGAQAFWQLSGDGVLDLDPRHLRDRSSSLVVMRPDGAAGVAAQVRAEVRLGWLDPTRWGLLAGGILLVAGAVVVLIRPVRPREVVFVVEPAQVPVLAARLGVATLLDPSPVPSSVSSPIPSPVTDPVAGPPVPGRPVPGPPVPGPPVMGPPVTASPVTGPPAVAPAAMPPTGVTPRRHPAESALVDRPATLVWPPDGRSAPTPQPAWPAPAWPAPTLERVGGPPGWGSARGTRVSAAPAEPGAAATASAAATMASAATALATHPTAARRNMARSRWWNPLRRNGAGEPADRT